MQQEKDKVYELVKADYENGMTYKELEEKHGISSNTIKSWRTRHHWERKKKKIGTKAKKKRTAGKAEDEQDPTDTNLTNLQELFCTYFIRCFNATRAYMMAYDVSYSVAAAAGSRLLKNKYIKQRIRELKKNRMNQSLLKPEDIVQKYIDIACSDMSNFAEVKGNSIIFKNTNGDMAGVKKITTGKTRSIEMQDQMKALQWLADHMDLATEEQRLRIAKMQIDINRATGKKDDDELTKVDELLEQIKQQAGEADDTES